MINITVKGTGEAKQAFQLLDKSNRQMPRAVERATLVIAHELRTLIVKGIRRGWPYGGDKFKPNAESTRKMKKSSKPLIRHGDLIRSVNVTPIQAGRALFVGIHRETHGKGKLSMVNLAELHEFGGRRAYKIKVTRKLRRFWMAMFLKGVFKAPLHWTTEYIKHPATPARPFLRPTYLYWSRTANEHFGAELGKHMTFFGKMGARVSLAHSAGGAV